MASNTIIYGAQSIRTNMSEAIGGMYLAANGNAQVIETANTPIALRNFTEGMTEDFTFDAGSTGSITAYADYNGTVANTTLVTSNAHGLTDLDIITIRGSANYKGIRHIHYVDANSYYIDVAFAGDDGASDFEQPSHLVCNVAGNYKGHYTLSASEAGGAASTVLYSIYKNETIQAPSSMQHKFTNNDVDAFGGEAIMTLASGDWVWLAANSSGTNNITHGYGNMIFTKL